MTYCHTSAQTDRYLNGLGASESAAETFCESERYDECVAEFIANAAEEGEIVTAADYPGSYAFENDLEAFIQALIDNSI